MPRLTCCRMLLHKCHASAAAAATTHMPFSAAAAGPLQCQEVRTLQRLLQAGVSCARVDLSWGTKEYHARRWASRWAGGLVGRLMQQRAGQRAQAPAAGDELCSYTRPV